MHERLHYFRQTRLELLPGYSDRLAKPGDDPGRHRLDNENIKISKLKQRRCIRESRQIDFPGIDVFLRVSLEHLRPSLNRYTSQSLRHFSRCFRFGDEQADFRVIQHIPGVSSEPTHV